MEEPEEVFMGASRKTKTSKFEDAIEELEQSQFKRVTMTKKEKTALKTKRTEEMQDRFETLDDDNAAIENILKRDYATASHKENEGYSQASKSKFAKSLKKMQHEKQRPRDMKHVEKQGGKPVNKHKNH